MVLQAHIDDSKSNEEVLVLAGYIAPFEEWKAFSIAWNALLKDPPEWSEFKMKYAIRYLDRAEKFYRLVEKYVVGSVVCIVDIQALRRVCQDLELPAFCWNPYNLAIRAITDTTAHGQHYLGLGDQPIEFIFDERGEKKYVGLGWPHYETSIPKEIRKRLGSKPRFEKSIEVAPLQAAEIAAWHAREHWLKHRENVLSSDIELSWTKHKNIPTDVVYWDYPSIKRNMVRLQQMLLRAGVAPPGRSIVELTVTFSSFDPRSDSERQQ